MDRYSVPENYSVIELNGLKGIARFAKDGSIKTVVDVINTECMVARSYGKIFLAYIGTDGSGYINLCTYNRKQYCDLFISDIRFGANCIYVRTIDPYNNQQSWGLLDKDMMVKKYLLDFDIIDEKCKDGYFIPVNREYMEIMRANGKRYMLELSTGNAEEIREKAVKVTIETVKNETTSYDIVLDTRNNNIQAISDLGKEYKVTSIGRLIQHIESITSLIGVNPTTFGDETDKETKETKKAKKVNYRYSDIPKERAELFFKVMRRFEYMGDISSLNLLIKHVIHTRKENYCLVEEVLKELTNGFVDVITESDGKYKVKCYAIEASLVVLIKNKNNRIVPFVTNLLEGPSGFEEEDKDAVKNYYITNQIPSVELNIKSITSKTVKCTPEMTNRFKVPYAVANTRGATGATEMTYYERVHSVNIIVEIGDIEIPLLILDGFCYIPKVSKYAKTVVAKGKTNNILAMLK